MKLPIYLDNHSTTPLDPAVLEAMMPALKEDFGNAASKNHIFGSKAAKLVETAREQAARLINASETDEIIFTSGATESDNLALKGVAYTYRDKGNHIVTCAIEHKSVIDACRSLEKEGFRVTFLPVDREGLVSPEDVNKAINDKTILVSIMAANNEIGTVQDMGAIGRVAHEKGVLFHTDAAQAAGKIPLDVQAMEIDLLSFSAHKFYGPKGAGALYVRKKNPRVRLTPLLDGGGHERGIRSGTLNVPGIIGLGKACEIALKVLPEEARRILALRESLRRTLWQNLDEIYLNGSLEKRLPGNLNVSFAYVEGESLLTAMSEEIAVSSGSACMTANPEPSYVLKSIGVPEEFAHTSVRFGIGRFNTREEIDYAARRFSESVKQLRSLSPLYDLAKSGQFKSRAV